MKLRLKTELYAGELPNTIKRGNSAEEAKRMTAWLRARGQVNAWRKRKK